MTQWQYDAIRKCIIAGMPAAANELIGAFDGLVREYNEAKQIQSLQKRKRQSKEVVHGVR